MKSLINLILTMNLIFQRKKNKQQPNLCVSEIWNLLKTH